MVFLTALQVMPGVSSYSERGDNVARSTTVYTPPNDGQAK